MQPTIYLLKTVDDNRSLYKIGYTKTSIFNRIKGLQTGNPHDILLVDRFESKYAKKIEITLHNLFKSKNTHGEWFALDISDEVNFNKLCERYHDIYQSIDDLDFTKNNY